MSFKIDEDELRWLAQFGFLAVSQSDLPAAQAIFRAVQSELPQAPAAYVGLAVAQLGQGDTGSAIEELQRGLEMVIPSDRPELQALMGVALWVAGQRAESLRALKAAGDTPLALGMLDKVCRIPAGA
jgi:predicted Zn-dependent protease